MSTSTPGPADRPDADGGIKATIVQAALETLKTRGFARASAREIAKAGGFNQALIFYHYGSVQLALLAALDLVSERRMAAYRPAFEAARTLPELADLAGQIYREDLENGYVTVLSEMVAGAVSNPELGREVSKRIEPWLELVEAKVSELTRGSMLAPFVSARDVAFAIVALYLGIDMLTHLDQDRSRGESLLALGVRVTPLAQALLPIRSQE